MRDILGIKSAKIKEMTTIWVWLIFIEYPTMVLAPFFSNIYGTFNMIHHILNYKTN